MLEKHAHEKVSTNIKKLGQQNLDDIADNLSKILKTLVDSSLESFERKANALVMEGSGWSDKVNIHKTSL